jgi:hypothetical protein
VIVTVAIVVGDLGTIFNITGAVSANCIGYILPALFYIRCAKTKDTDYYISWGLFFFGCISGIVCIISEFLPK